MNGVYKSNLKEVYRIFAAKIKCLIYLSGEGIDRNLFPNIERVKLISLYDDPLISYLNLVKLKELEVVIEEGQEHILQVFIDNSPTLESLSVGFLSNNENAIYKSLKNISNLKHLIHFDIEIVGKNNEIICDLLKQIANNCQNIKSFCCRFIINVKNTNIRQFFSQLKAFPALKRLKLYFLDIEGEDNIDVNQLFSFELFKRFSNITHLTLEFVDEITLKDSFLTDIDINLSNLENLEIS